MRKVREMERRGDFLRFRVDWENDTMHIEEVSPVVRKVSGDRLKTSVPITPMTHTLESLTQMNPESEMPYRFLFDVQYSHSSLVVNIHRAEDYLSVVDVPRHRLEKVIGRLLTPREFEVAALLFGGRTIRYIASSLYIAEGTVKRIIYNIYQKLGVASQVELIQELYTRLAQYYSTPR